MMDADHWLSLGTNIGTQAIIVYAIKKSAELGAKLIEGVRERQMSWLNIQKELELARIDRGTNVLGPREIRIPSAASYVGECGTPPPAASTA